MKEEKFPEVFWNGKWAPICGHNFWDGMYGEGYSLNHGANLFCRKLNSSIYSLGILTRNNDKPLESDGLRIGSCPPDTDNWASCSRFWEMGNPSSICSAGQLASIEIKCLSVPAISDEVRLKEGKFPEVFVNVYGENIWAPICGHDFWNSDNGANLFCQKLDSSLYTSGKVKKIRGPLERDGLRIGACCDQDTKWMACTCGGNQLGIPSTLCSAGQNASIEIECISDPSTSRRRRAAENWSTTSTTRTNTNSIGKFSVLATLTKPILNSKGSI